MPEVEKPAPARGRMFLRQHPSVLLFVLALSLGALLIVWIDSLERIQIEKTYQQQITSAESQIARQTTTLISEIQRASLSLDRELVLSGALSVEQAFNRKQVEALFRNFVQDHPLIFQIRWLDQSGMERSRIDRRRQQNNPDRFPSAEILQDKSDRDYVKQSNQLAPGEFYNSYVDLNREFGEIAQPHRPVIRTATRTYPTRGELAGTLVINFDLSRYLHTLSQVAEATGVGIDILDAKDGRVYLSTTHPAMAFSHELGGPQSPLWQQFPERQADHRTFVDSNERQRRTAYQLLLRGPTVALDGGSNPANIARQVWSRGDTMQMSDGGILMDLTIPPARIADDYRAVRMFSLGAFSCAVGVISLFAFMAFRLERKNIEALTQARNLADAKSQFLANMSHEIRTPLAGVIGMLELIEENTESRENRERIEFVKQSTRSLRQIIDDILDISKMQGDRLELKTTTFKPADTVARVVQLYAAPATNKGIELTAVTPSEIEELAVQGDELRIEQVLNNLVSNAIKFTEAGRVVLELSTISSDKDRVGLRFSVSDTGIGIEQELIERLGDAFFQADASNTREFGGTGLGLSICQNLLVMMGSELEIASTRGAGTRVSFDLDFQHAQPQQTQDLEGELEQTATLHPDSSNSMEETLRCMVQAYGPPKTLVVEDSVSMQFLIEAIFQNLDIPITIVENGREAVERTGEEAFDLVFMDLQMPVMGGVEATRQIRTRFPADSLPIVILTATVQDEEIQAALSAGANDHLGKPIDMEGLLGAILRFWQPPEGAQQ